MEATALNLPADLRAALDQDIGSVDTTHLGIAAFLDVLGARVRTQAEAEELLGRVRDLVEYTERSVLPGLNTVIQGTNLRDEIGHPDVRVVGDAILLTWVIGGKTGLFLHCSLLLQEMFVRALMNLLPVRGAIGIGDIFYGEGEKNAVLGSGITDCADWFERPDIIGVIATPRYGLFLEWLMAEMKMDEEGMLPFYLRYPTPLSGEKRGEKSESMWTLSWPYVYLEDCRLAGCDARKTLLHDFSRFEMPVGTEQKYRYAHDFYDHYMGTWGGEDQIRRPHDQPYVKDIVTPWPSNGNAQTPPSAPADLSPA
jgi:hypothetical protein